MEAFPTTSPSTGASLSVIEPPWSLAGLVELSMNVLGSMDALPATFVGHSFGGAIALKLAADFPESVSRLLLVNALGVSPGRRALLRTVVPGAHWRIGMRRSTAAALLSSVAGGGWSSLSASTSRIDFWRLERLKYFAGVLMPIYSSTVTGIARSKSWRCGT